MDLRIFTEPQQGASYADQLRLALAAEAAGYSAFFRSDHYVAMSGDGLPGPTDSYVTLAGLARETSTIRLGTLVTAATFRYPGILAISAAQVDEMSGGRLELGLGAGWFEAEHQAYGIPFGSGPERFDLLEDTLNIVTGLWKTPVGQTFCHDGIAVSVKDSPALPKPTQQYPPIVMGGGGKKRTPALAAKFASEFNLPFVSMEVAAAQFARVRAACEAIGRSPESLDWSVALVACVGRDDAEVARRAAAIGRDVDELKENGLAGTPDEVVERLGQWQEATGIGRAYLQMLDIADVDHTEFVAQTVMPQVTA